MTARPRALLVCANPLPLTGGDSIYTYGIALRLAALYELDVLALSRRRQVERDEPKDRLEAACHEFRRVVVPPNEERPSYRFLHNWSSRVFSRALVRAVDRQLSAGGYAAVFIDHFRLSYVLPVVRAAVPEVPIASIHHNIEYDNFREELKEERRLTRRLMLLMKNARLHASEASFLTGSDVNFFISEEDRQRGLALARNDGTETRVLPAFFPFRRTKPEAELQRECSCWMLLGSLEWYPNYHGAAWFVREVFPRLREELPRSRVIVVGRLGDRSLEPFKTEGVEVRGYASDTEPVFREADLLLVPNELGGGAKMKILEALGRGMPVVARTRSTRGFPQSLFGDGFSAGTPEEFAARVISVANDHAARLRFVRRGLQYVNEQTSLPPSVVAGLGYPGRSH